MIECSARRLSENTILDYKSTLNKFASMVSNTSVGSIDSSHIAQFLSSFPQLSPKSLLNKYVALSAFWTWLCRNGYSDQHMVHRIPRPKVNPPVIEPFSELEIRAMFSALGRRYNRNRAILILLLDTGLRASELINLEWEDIDLKNCRIKVLGKGNKERFVPFSSRTAAVLFRYHTQYKGKPFELTRTRLAHLLQEIGKRAGVERVYPHRFRHTFAIFYLRNGGDIFSLQAILGHSSLEMVKRYLHLAQVDIDKVHQRASPVDRLRL